MDEGAHFNRTATCPPSTEGTSESCRGLNQGQCLFRLVLPSETAVQTLLCLFVVLTIFSVLFNGYALYGLGQSEDLSWEPRFSLLKNLIVSDLLFILSHGPTIIHCLLHRSTLRYGTWCLAQYFIETVCIFCAILTITCMALERYLYVCQAIYYLHILTSKRLYLIVSLTWLLSASITVVNAALMSKGHKAALLGQWTTGLLCEPDTLEVHLGFPRLVAVYRKVSGFAVTALCVCSYAYFYLRMYQEAQNAVQPFQQVNHRARSTVLLYCSMFLMQLLPLFLKIISDVLWEIEGAAGHRGADDHSASGWRRAGVLHVMLLVLLQVPPCINPLVYGLRNREVRRGLPRVMWWRKTRQEISIDT